MFTIHRLQRCSKQCVVDARRRILQVLSVQNPGLDQRGSRRIVSAMNLSADALIQAKVDVRREDGERAIWWVRGWRAMGEKSRLEWLVAASERRNALIYDLLLTLVSFVNAFKKEIWGRHGLNAVWEVTATCKRGRLLIHRCLIQSSCTRTRRLQGSPQNV
jgi:hypothetical protein